jgi:predicted GIY-YIG superfamily endonuclease
MSTVYIVAPETMELMYLGSTNDFERRLREHNAEKGNGAGVLKRFTKKGIKVVPIVTVSGFERVAQARSFEALLKNKCQSRRKAGLDAETKKAINGLSCHYRFKNLAEGLHYAQASHAGCSLVLRWRDASTVPCDWEKIAPPGIGTAFFAQT